MTVATFNKTVAMTALVAVIALWPFSSKALTISPARLEIVGNPGENVGGDFTLTNEQDGTRTFYSSSENFEAQGESGAPNFVPGNTGLASWIHLESSVTLAKGQEKKIPFIISIPKDAEPGGYFAATFLSSSPASTGEGQVSVGARIGILILLKVAGEAKEAGGLVDFVAAGGKFHTSLPISFSYRFRNDGGDRIKPEGTLVIKNLFGMTTESLSANPSQGNILPGSVRKFDLVWGQDKAPSGFFSSAAYQFSHFALGFYTASLNLAYGDKGLTAESSAPLLVIPWQLLVTAIVIIGVGLLILITAIKRYNRYIISQARKG